jgi:hypothetical protein
MGKGWRGPALLLLAAVVTEAVLIWFTLLMSLLRFFPASNPGKEQISLDFDLMLGSHWLRNTLWQAAAFAVLFLAFFISLWVVRRAPRSTAMLLIIFLAPVVWTVTAAFMYPPYARDLFHNLEDVRLLWVYHVNPMVVAPTARPFPIRTSFDDQPNPYGPLWFILGFPGAVFQSHDFLSSIILLKIWMGAFYIASGVIIYIIVKHEQRELALLASALYLWNPFVIMRDLGDAHNDVMMFFFVLVAIYVGLRRRWLLVPPVLMLSILIKYVSLLIAPVMLAYILFLPGDERRQALRGILAGSALALALAVLMVLPFWDGLRTFDALRNETSKVVTSTPQVLEYIVTGSVEATRFASTSRLIMRLLFLIPYVWLLLRVRPPAWRLNAAAYQALLLYLLIAVAWFRPWYLLWVVTIGALLPWGWFLAVTLTISWFGMFPEIVGLYSGKVPWLAASDGRMLLGPILVVFLPIALLWLAGLVCTRSWFFVTTRRSPGVAPRSAQHAHRTPAIVGTILYGVAPIAVSGALASGILTFAAFHPLLEEPVARPQTVLPQGHEEAMPAAVSSDGFNVIDDSVLGCPFRTFYQTAGTTLGPAIGPVATVDGLLQQPFEYGILHCQPDAEQPVQPAAIGLELMQARDLRPQFNAQLAQPVRAYLDEVAQEGFDPAFAGKPLSSQLCTKAACEQYAERAVFAWDPRETSPAVGWEPAGCLATPSCGALQKQPSAASVRRPLLRIAALVAAVTVIVSLLQVASLAWRRPIAVPSNMPPVGFSK